ncbi:hypothetical protein E2C01_009752 [Portunus trituberculatus]|uniref:Uncharacterized protein n=1 Tax=Portunus trituberculatus TaxID=210409 RepID=A0A5B7D6L9_PORTR|nr:hypothetical protein [Portunus trituberculatus]
MRTIGGTPSGLSDFQGCKAVRAWKTSLQRILIEGMK